MKLIIDIPEKDYKRITKYQNVSGCGNMLTNSIINGTLLDSVKAEIERLKHQYTDVSGYRWWNNAIDNCLHTIRDVCDAESEDNK